MHIHSCILPALYLIICCCYSEVRAINHVPFNDAGSLNAKRIDSIENVAWPGGSFVRLSAFDPDSDPLALTAKKALQIDKITVSCGANNNDATQLWMPPTDAILRDLRSFIFLHEGHVLDCLVSVPRSIFSLFFVSYSRELK